MKVLFWLTFVVLIVVSWTHPVVRGQLTQYGEVIGKIAETQSLSIAGTSVPVDSPEPENVKTEPTKKPAPVKTPPVEKKEPPEVSVSPPSTPPPAPPPSPSANFQQELEQEVHARVNTIRQEFGFSTLTWNATLADISRGHSRDMLANDYFSHEDSAGCDMACRAEKVDFSWQAIGENIYMMSGYDLNAEEQAAMIISGWMNSPGHRANILNDAFTMQGIGVAYENDEVYITETLAKPPSH